MKFYLFLAFLILLYTEQIAAYDTVGCQLQPADFNSRQNLTQLKWTSDILEYETDSPTNSSCPYLRIEFNQVWFIGNKGTMTVGAMIQNCIHKFDNNSCKPEGWKTEDLTSGIGIYFTYNSTENPGYNCKEGVELLANPEEYPKFSRVFEDVDDAGTVKDNIYTRESLGTPSFDKPIVVKWLVKCSKVVDNPSGDLNRDNFCDEEKLEGKFVKWEFTIIINEKEYKVANYYLPVEFAEYIHPYTPLVFGQEHFGACGNHLNKHKTTVRYYDIGVSIDKGKWINLDNWVIVNNCINPECGNSAADERYGWCQEGRYLISSSGHEYDINRNRAINTKFILKEINETAVRKIFTDKKSLELIEFKQGSFTEMCTNEAIVSFHDFSQAHVEGYGEIWLLKMVGGIWKSIRKLEDTDIVSFKIYDVDRDGKSEVWIETNAGGQGHEYFDYYLVSLDKESSIRLFETSGFDHSGAISYEIDGNGVAVVSNLHNVEFNDTDNDGILELIDTRTRAVLTQENGVYDPDSLSTDVTEKSIYKLIGNKFVKQ